MSVDGRLSLPARAILPCLLAALATGCGDGDEVCDPPGEVDPAPETFLVERAEGRFRDFAFVHDGERYHIIGIDGRNGDWTEATDGDAYGFVHMTSADLRTWTEEEPLAAPLYAHEYARDHIWAPSIIRVDGTWTMFYTGVRRGATVAANEQRIMRSTSRDLFTWTEPEFVLDGTHPGTSWGGGEAWDDDCRDPHVFAIDAASGVYGMVLSLRQADRDAMIIGWAVTRDFTDWTITSLLEQTGTLFWDYYYVGEVSQKFAESPFLLEHEGRRYLFRTANHGDFPVVQFGGPTWFLDQGKACEILPRGDGTYWFAHLVGPDTNGFDIEITTLVFEDERPFLGG